MCRSRFTLPAPTPVNATSAGGLPGCGSSANQTGVAIGSPDFRNVVSSRYDPRGSGSGQVAGMSHGTSAGRVTVLS